jgi:Holliday junction DNA helicase RuvB
MDERGDQGERVVSGATRDEEHEFETMLRPSTLDEFVGQAREKNNLRVFIEAARKRDDALDHVLFCGPPGLGKTTLARILANELNVSVRASSGPVLEKPGDLAGMLTNLERRDILFIDEVHRLRRIVEEYLYPAMEDFVFDIMMGDGPAARSVRIPLKPFTLVGSTTRAGMLSAPMRARFGYVCRLDYYSPEDLVTIALRSAGILGLRCEEEAALVLGRRARGTPRVVNRLLRRARDVAEVKAEGVVTRDVVVETLAMLGVDELGLEEMDRRILKAIIEHYGGGPVGLNTVAVVVGEEADTIEEVYEPFLIQAGLLKRTPRGREATGKAYEYFGLKPKRRGSQNQGDLFDGGQTQGGQA